MQPDHPLAIRAVIADLSGTLLDFGSRAPGSAFVRLFQMYEVSIAEEEIRVPTELDKRSQVEALLFNPSIASEWETAHGRRPERADVDRLYAKFGPIQVQTLKDHCELIPGVADAAAALRKAGVGLGVTTDYDRAMLEIMVRALNDDGLSPDSVLCADEVPEGRPHPWMIFRSMERLGAYPPSCVVKVGDTRADMEAGRNAGVWCVGVSETGSLMGLDERKLSHMRENIREQRREDAEDILLEAGAHFTVASFAELPDRLDEIKQRLADGRRP